MLASQALGFYQPQCWVLSARALGYSSWSARFYQLVRWVLSAGVLGFISQSAGCCQLERWVISVGRLGIVSRNLDIVSQKPDIIRQTVGHSYSEHRLQLTGTLCCQPECGY